MFKINNYIYKKYKFKNILIYSFYLQLIIFNEIYKYLLNSKNF
jgi:hypothetical protein